MLIYKQLLIELVNYPFCFMLLYGFTEAQTAVDVDCECIAEIVYWSALFGN